MRTAQHAGDDGEAWIEDVRETLSGLLGRGRCRIQDLAAARGTSVRTLQRRLAETGLTYSRVVDEIRFAEARRRLAQPGALLKEVAADVGFCEPASFTRACRRWTGLSPRELRRRLQASGPGGSLAGSARRAATAPSAAPGSAAK